MDIFREHCGHWAVGRGVCGVLCVSAEAGEDREWEEEDVENTHRHWRCSQMEVMGHVDCKIMRCWTLETYLRDTLMVDAQWRY